MYWLKFLRVRTQTAFFSRDRKRNVTTMKFHRTTVTRRPFVMLESTPE